MPSDKSTPLPPRAALDAIRAEVDHVTVWDTEHAAIEAACQRGAYCRTLLALCDALAAALREAPYDHGHQYEDAEMPCETDCPMCPWRERKDTLLASLDGPQAGK